MCKSFPSPRPLSASAVPSRAGLPRNQALVMRALRAAKGRALTAYAVLERLRPEGIRGPQTVYRALDALSEAGLIHRIESLNAYTSAVSTRPSCGCAPAPYDDHAHPTAFAVCRDCGAVREMEDAALAAVLGVAADGSGYRVERGVVELVGQCPDCAHAAAGR